MSVIGKVESLWRYPVKSMRGEELDEAFQVTREFTATAYSHSKVRRVQPDSPTSRRASSKDFCNIVLGFVIPTKLRVPSIWPKQRGRAPVRSRRISQSSMVDVETPEGKTLAIDDPVLRRTCCGPMLTQSMSWR